MTFHAVKHGLSRDETLPLAILCFVNHLFTSKNPCNHLSVNTLPEIVKMPFFRPSDPFVRADGLNLGPKFEYYLTELSKANIQSGVGRSKVSG